MRLDQVQVELRPRSPWEAMELGIALVRRHARAIWLPWAAITLPLFIVLNALAWTLDLVPLAALAMWWLKPVFDRVPLYVLSRAVFGQAPAVRETLAAQRRWGWRPMAAYLTWRRLGPARALYLPVDLLEGGAGGGARRQVIGGSARGMAILLTLACANFEAVLVFGMYASVVLFVPVEFLSESARALWTLAFEAPPRWAQLAGNALVWVASSAIEPFYVGAGFGMYLNRRTQIEGWDIELAFRRLRTRIAGLSTALLVGAMLCLPMPPAAAADDPPRKAATPAPSTLPRVFGEVEDARAFKAATEAAYRDPLLSPERKATRWVSRDPRKPRQDSEVPVWLQRVGDAIAALGEYGLWFLFGGLALLLAWTRKTWWPWMRDLTAAPAPAPTALRLEPHADAEPLPADPAAAARALWSAGRRRRALALLYRASVAAMAARIDAVLVPGATEAECLRAARGMADADDRDAFAQVVRVWQYAAYAERLPDDAGFDALASRLAARFAWGTPA